MKVRDFRSNFRRGRIGKALHIRTDTQAYIASVADAMNMMVTAEGQIMRRWGTLKKAIMPGALRIEPWVYAPADAGRFLLVFGAGTLTILDMTLATRATFAGMPWDASSLRFMQLSIERNRCVISDASFRTKIVTFDAAAGSFSERDFAFTVSEDKTRLQAPFYSFAPADATFSVNIMTSAGVSTGYAPHIETAFGFAPGSFDLAAGTGTISSSEDFFDASHVGTRMRLLEGEFEILTVVDARNATIKCWRDIARRLDTDPLFIRKSSKIVEVSMFGHGLKVGDQIFLAGLATGSAAATLLNHAPAVATSLTTAPAPPGGAATYAVERVIDADHFEILGAGAAPANDALDGGADIYLYRPNDLPNVAEPVFSDVRGWPQASAFHEKRLWLGGSNSLPDSAFASQFNQAENFDTGTGEPTDAIQAFGLGQQNRIIHMVSEFDLVVMTEGGERYIPGSTDQAIIQETARALNATNNGAAYTIPRQFDGSIYFVDAIGQHVREFSSRARDEKYTAAPITVATPDWVREPNDTTVFNGGPHETTPYLLHVNWKDGTILVLHSSKQDDAFGFMLWSYGDGPFLSVAGVGNRLFALVDDQVYGETLVEFDTRHQLERAPMDMAEEQFDIAPKSIWSFPDYANQTVQVMSGRRVYSDATLSATGDLDMPEPVSSVMIGRPMPWFFDMTPTVVSISGQQFTGQMQRLVRADVYWQDAEYGFVMDEFAFDGNDNPAFSEPVPVSEWREYWIGEWGKSVRLRLHGDKPGHVCVGAINMVAYV